MSPITHFLASWTVAECATKDHGERLWFCLAGIAPDLDGFGVVVDAANDALGRAPTQWFAVYHHWLLHGLFGALAVVAIARMAGIRRWPALVLVFLSVHLHLLCDLLGARGPASYDIWAIHYLGPVTKAWTFSWAHQWPLNDWRNIVLTAALLAWTVRQTIRNGASPVSLLNRRWDAAVVAALRARFAQLRSDRV